MAPTDAGKYFSWGNVEGHTVGDGYNFSQANYDASPGASVSTDLDAAHDAATVIDGSAWRIPTAAEVQELINNCTYEFVTVGGVAGSRFTSNINGKSVFIPAAGFISGTSVAHLGESGFVWSATRVSETTVDRLMLTESIAQIGMIGNRQYGFSIRGVSSS